MSLLIVLLQAPHVPWRCQVSSVSVMVRTTCCLGRLGGLGHRMVVSITSLSFWHRPGKPGCLHAVTWLSAPTYRPWSRGESQLLAEAPSPPFGPVAMGSFLFPQAAGCGLAHCHPGSGFPQRTSRYTCVVGLSGDRHLTH